MMAGTRLIALPAKGLYKPQSAADYQKEFDRVTQNLDQVVTKIIQNREPPTVAKYPRTFGRGRHDSHQLDY